jgi:cyclopropane fatty-acyl-phospholipid synthase-like methyltransferase
MSTLQHEKGSMNNVYIHDYEDRENMRLQDQAATLVELLHFDTSYPAGSRVLEAGCGVGGLVHGLRRFR